MNKNSTFFFILVKFVTRWWWCSGSVGSGSGVLFFSFSSSAIIRDIEKAPMEMVRFTFPGTQRS